MDELKLKFEGFLRITDKDTGEVLVDKKNAINFINMSEAIALSLANRNNGYIRKMLFGIGASTVSGIGTITYYPPNVNSSDATLYRKTYSKIVDQTDPSLSNDPQSRDYNYMVVQKTGTNSTYADIVVTSTLGQNEPGDQALYDYEMDSDGLYVFDEIGLESSGGKLLTHVIFNPIQKSRNRIIEIEYTLRIYMS